MRRRLAVFLVPLAFSLAGQAQSSATGSAPERKCNVQVAPPASPADHAVASGDLAGAETLYAAQLQSKPATSDFTGLVTVQLEENKLSEALASAQLAVAAFPTSGDAQALLGDAYLRAGQIAEADAAYRKALTLDPCSPAAHFGYGRLAGLASRHTVERQQQTIAHQLAPANPVYTAAQIDFLPPAERQAQLKSLLDAHPLLPPETQQDLATELALLTAGASCHPVKPYDKAELSLKPLLFQAKITRSWGLEVKANDKGLPILELDSSVSGIVLTPRDAEKAGIHPLPGQPATGIYTGLAQNLRVGSLEFQNCPVRVDPALDISHSHSLIGLDFFRDHLLHRDYVAETLTLTPFPAIPPAQAGENHDGFVAADEKDWSPIYIAKGQLLLPTMADHKGPYLFAMDTGITDEVVAPSIARNGIGVLPSTVNLTGISGPIVKVLEREGGTNTDRTDIFGTSGKLISVTRPLRLVGLTFAHNRPAAARSSVSA